MAKVMWSRGRVVVVARGSASDPLQIANPFLHLACRLLIVIRAIHLVNFVGVFRFSKLRLLHDANVDKKFDAS